MRWFRRYRPHVPPTVKKNIDSVKELEEELARQRSRLDRLSDAITRFTGSVRFVIAHLVFFAVWMAVNAAWFLGAAAFDPYPFVFLNLVLAMETVILSTFVLMSQNRQQRQAEQNRPVPVQNVGADGQQQQQRAQAHTAGHGAALDETIPCPAPPCTAHQ